MECQGFYLIQHQEGEAITDQANVTYLKFKGQWFKLHFDGETIFWRNGEEPSEPINIGLSSCLSLLNLNEFDGVMGYKLDSIRYDSNDEIVFVDLVFSSGKVIKFQHHGYDDYTSINC